ncbi:MAG: serine/threonine-protein kinase, partial [Acidobacteriota bacterium]
MGRVYLAERDDDTYRQRVAIKLADPTSAQDLGHSFRSERQILANLEHPNIARLLDGGTTEDRQPYLVMEYIEGTQIIDYCEAHDLTVSERLELFSSVCAAVQYAHRNLVVHRDLKPQNLMITDDGTPKLLDFGIAKLLEPEAATGTEVTQRGLRPLTPNYASPEQLRGQQITTSTDIYSLGVLLYRLLTGRTPRVFDSLTPTAVERSLAEEPTSPELDRDLDRIVLKALDEAPDQRYASVEQLAEDLRRYAAGRPILARPHTLSYRATKFLRRHRLAAAVAAAVALLLIGFAVDKDRQAAELARERDRARIENAKAQELSTFLVDLLRSSDPWQSPGREVTVREVLDRGSQEIHHRLDDEPELRGMLLDTMGSIYLGLAQYENSLPLLEAGLAERRRALPADHPDIATSLHNLGGHHLAKGSYGQAEPFFRQAIAIRRGLGPDEVSVADSLHQLGMALYLNGSLDEAERCHREALELRQRVLSEDHIDVAGSQDQLATLLTELGRFEEASELFQKALATQRQQLGNSHPQVSMTLTHLASLKRFRGDLDGAEAMFREALEIKRSVFDELHTQVGQTKNNLAAVLFEQGDVAAAEVLYREVLDQAIRVLGENHRDVAVVNDSLGKVMLMKGDLAAAESHFRRAFEIVSEVLPPGHPGAAYALQNLGRVKIQAGEAEQAESLLRTALELRVAGLPADHPATADTRGVLGNLLVQQGRLQEAEKLLVESFETLAASQSGQRVEVARERLAALYEAQGKPDKAAELRGQPSS